MRAELRVTPRPTRTALRAAWLFDGTGPALTPDPVVVLDGLVISAVGSGGSIPDDAAVVDFGAATLLPGLIDTHVHPITTPGGHCHFLGGAIAPTAEAIRAAVREHAEQGVDVIKIMASGGYLTPGSIST